ncbi:hypothetical protein OGATHE_004542 [Ogataea polymorpha]|uniref:Uncharacterized protein n=1 Tax=Ogataea polymorpha TaxID=460523 RepID=A0A9P8P0Y9_9ASCO|nr:hypothetical protein OGATHE_004542 [Ogataea polymorpha]
MDRDESSVSDRLGLAEATFSDRDITELVFFLLLGRGGAGFFGDLGLSSDDDECAAYGRFNWKLCCNCWTFPNLEIKGEMFDWNGGMSTTTRLSSDLSGRVASLEYSRHRCWISAMKELDSCS